MDVHIPQMRMPVAPIVGPAVTGPALYPPAVSVLLPASVVPSFAPSLQVPALAPAAVVVPKAAPAVVKSIETAVSAIVNPQIADSGAAGAALFDGAANDDVLAGERPFFSPDRVSQIQATNLALTAAVRSAASAVLGEDAQVLSRGSTARGTYAQQDPDYDIGVTVPTSWSKTDFERFGSLFSSQFRRALASAVEREAAALLPGHTPHAEVSGPIALSDPATFQPQNGASLYRIKLSWAGSAMLVNADVPLAVDPHYSNDYPRYFAEQLRQVELLGGHAAVSRVLSDIQLAKRLFKESVGAYKFYEGGPSAVGIEQMIMQSGRVSDVDKGRTILEVGSFDKMMKRLAAAGESGDFKSFQAAWTVHNPFMAPANFLSLMRAGTGKTPSWKRASAAARGYLQARAAGGPVTLDQLKPKALAARPRPSGSADRALVNVKLSGRWKDARSHLRNLTSQLGGGASINSVRRNGQTALVDVQLSPNADPETQAARIKSFFAKPNDGAELVSISLPASTLNAPAPVEPAAPTTAPPSIDPAGKLTMAMLEKFTTMGPKPSRRGLEYRYAQGAEALPKGLEESWANRKPAAAPRGAPTLRTLLLRRGERVFVMAPGTNDQGGQTMRPVPLDSALVQGVVSDSLVEVSRQGQQNVVRPVGAFLQDMMIGRVVRRGGSMVLEGMFRDGKGSVSLYKPLDIEGGIAVREGTLVQAFVSPSPAGYKATPLIDLGSTITPEIAAREIALRRGARGYIQKAVIEQAEGLGRDDDPARDYAKIKAALDASGKGKIEDLSDKDFVTIDPPGAGDLDDAFYVEKNADGGYTWYLATADVAHYVHPGSPAFQAAAKIGNTFYSIDKDGVPEYPMNHPVVSKNLASLLSGKDSLAMISRMKFDANGKFMIGSSEVFLGKVHVKGRYTYPQVANLWSGKDGHGIEQVDQVQMARELSRKLTREDLDRGMMRLTLGELEHHKRDGKWVSEVEKEDPVLRQSHELIEELKVYGNRAIAVLLDEISDKTGVPHISRVHPEQNEGVTARLKRDLASIGAPWEEGVTLAQYLKSVQESKKLSANAVTVAQTLVRNTRQSAKYTTSDTEGHEGLALKAGGYDHPSAPIRRFSDMYNRGLLETRLEGGDVKAYYAAVLKDLSAMGFESLEDYLTHLNGRQQAAKQMGYEVDAFMSIYELAQPENAGRAFKGYVSEVRGGRFTSATIALEGSAATVVVEGPDALKYHLLDPVEVTVKGADLASRKVDFTVGKPAAAAN